jgi:predicted  nucleic acid-binding Zn-ribbon protein
MTSESEAESESRNKLEERLSAVEKQLHQEMLVRGFDPAQDQNLALTGPLAKLFVEREELRAKLSEAGEGEY